MQYPTERSSTQLNKAVNNAVQVVQPETGLAPDGLQKCSSQSKCHHRGLVKGRQHLLRLFAFTKQSVYTILIMHRSLGFLPFLRCQKSMKSIDQFLVSEDVFVSLNNILIYDETEHAIQQHIMTT